jgi:hypothetical protein
VGELQALGAVEGADLDLVARHPGVVLQRDDRDPAAFENLAPAIERLVPGWLLENVGRLLLGFGATQSGLEFDHFAGIGIVNVAKLIEAVSSILVADCHGVVAELPFPAHEACIAPTLLIT